MSIVNGSDDDWLLDDSEKVEALQEMSGICPWKILIVDDLQANVLLLKKMLAM